jgi:hypothetical protein
MDITVTSTSTQVEDRSWLSSDFGCDEPRSITLDVTAFTAGTHFVNGFIPAGTVVGKITASGLYGPYNDAASNGSQTAAGILFSSVRVVKPQTGATVTAAAGAMLEMGLIVEAKLPFSGATTGAIDAAGKTDLVNWFKFL